MRFLFWLLNVFCLAVSLTLAWRCASVSFAQLMAPYDLQFETPNVCPILLIQRHVPLYAETTYNEPPFVLTAYTPLFHYLVSLFPIRESNPFFFGRLVTMIAFLGLGGIIVFRGQTSLSRLFGLFVAVLFLSIWPITKNVAFLKNDSLGILLAVSGMVLAARSRSFWVLCLSAFLAVAAVATKQIFVAATVATAVFLWTNNRRACWTYCVAVGIWATLAAAWATAYFGSGFWFSVVSAQRLPYEFGLGAWILGAGFSQPLALALVFAAVAVLYDQVRKFGAMNVVQTSPSSTYFAVAILFFLATCWKTGASTNSLFELFLAACLVVVESVRKLRWKRRWPEKAILLSAGLSFIGLFDIVTAERNTYSFAKEPASVQNHLANYRECVLLCGISRPRVLNLSWHQDMFMFGLEPSLNDPWLYRTLWANHRLSPDPVVAAVERLEYDVVILPGYRMEGIEEKLRAVLLDKFRVVAVDSDTQDSFFVRK